MDRYRIVRRIGEGGGGTVYEAHDETLGRNVALKLLVATAPEVRIVEARALAQLSHPNVVAVYDAGVFGDGVYIVMELVEGVDLATWRVDQRSWREIVGVFVKAGRGLAAAHAVGLIHRDFKPHNVLIGASGAVKVGDFGLATPTESRVGDAGTALEGTPAYMAPEQHDGLTLTRATDQFAFGVALLECLTAGKPYPQTTHRELLAAKLAGPPLLPPSLPRWLRRTVERALAPRGEHRFRSMDAFVAELERGLTLGRRRSLLVAGALLAAGAAAAVIFAVQRSPPDSGSELIASAADAREPSQPTAGAKVLEGAPPQLDLRAAWNHYYRAMDAWKSGEHAVAHKELAAAREITGRLLGEDDPFTAKLDMWQAWVYTLEGRYDVVRKTVEPALARLETTNELWFIANSRAILARALYESGDHEAGVAMGRRAHREVLALPDGTDKQELLSNIRLYMRQRGISVEEPR